MRKRKWSPKGPWRVGGRGWDGGGRGCDGDDAVGLNDHQVANSLGHIAKELDGQNNGVVWPEQRNHVLQVYKDVTGGRQVLFRLGIRGLGFFGAYAASRR